MPKWLFILYLTSGWFKCHNCRIYSVPLSPWCICSSASQQIFLCRKSQSSAWSGVPGGHGQCWCIRAIQGKVERYIQTNFYWWIESVSSQSTRIKQTPLLKTILSIFPLYSLSSAMLYLKFLLKYYIDDRLYIQKERDTN